MTPRSEPPPHDPREAADAEALEAPPRRKLRLALLIVIAVILTGWALHAMAAVVVPLIFAFFAALVVWPLDRWVQERTGQDWLGHLVAMTVIAAVILIFAAGLLVSAQQLMTRTDVISGEIAQAMDLRNDAGLEEADAEAAQDAAGEAAGNAAAPPAEGAAPTAGSDADRFSAMVNNIGAAAGNWLVENAAGIARGVATSIGTLTAAIFIVYFLILLMLAEAGRTEEKLASLLPPDACKTWLHAISTASSRLRRYLLVRALMGIITAALYVAWLWLFGLDLLLVWAVLTFLLSFVPNIGSVLSGALPLLYAMLSKDWTTVLAIGAGLFVIEQVIGNYLDPKLQGQTIELSPTVVLSVLLIFGWLWGISGALLAVPFTSALVIVCAYVRPLQPVAILLSNRTSLREIHALREG